LCEYKNIWIVKPAKLSRGRGIKVFNDLEQLLFYIMGREKMEWVIQKYIERPFLYQGRKFDIRQWVLVSNWEPLTVWVYEDCYVRVCFE
jgi:tubulin monoglycylase TTLL3/8